MARLYIILLLGLAPAALAQNVADASCGGHACVARKTDGSALAWGQACCGGDASGVDLSSNVADVSCGEGVACVARKTDGSAVAWGNADFGGDASGVDLSAGPSPSPPPPSPSPPPPSPSPPPPSPSPPPEASGGVGDPHLTFAHGGTRPSHSHGPELSSPKGCWVGAPAGLPAGLRPRRRARPTARVPRILLSSTYR